MGAKVNGRLVPLNSPLISGDTVEVLTSKNPDAGPSQDWLNFVQSTRAKSKIRTWFTKERRDEAIDQGKDSLAQAMRKMNLPLKKLTSQEALFAVANSLNLSGVSGLYAAIGEGHVSSQSVIEKLVAQTQEATEQEEVDAIAPTSRPRSAATGGAGVLVRGDPDVLVKLAKCCTPVPGDDIVGFITRGAGVSVHRATARTSPRCRPTPPA